MKPVILISYIMIIKNYVQHDVNMHLLPVFYSRSQIQVFINHTLFILIKIVILY